MARGSIGQYKECQVPKPQYSNCKSANRNCDRSSAPIVAQLANMTLATLVFSGVPLLIVYYALQYKEADHKSMLAEMASDYALPRINTYDFIVVGAGSAGCIVAGRLSEHFNVLLLEAGGNPVPASNVPAFVMPVAYDTLTNYEFPGLPQNHRILPTGAGVFSFGKMMGGSGQHNDMVHNRCSPYDYDNWANITGDPSWGYSQVLDYFRKYESFVGTLVEPGTEGNYGYEGPLKIDSDEQNPFLPTWFQAAGELGYRIGDPNGFQREGFHVMNKAIYQGKRQSSYVGFIRDVEATRANLTVLRYSDVQEILIDNSTKRAYGVEFLRHGVVQRAYASREIIVSAGAFRSPLLLQKSGVGPADVLADAGIEPKVIRPGVGRNLGEHMAITLDPIHLNASAHPFLPRLHDGDEEELERYKQTGEGVLGYLGDGPQAFLVSQRAKQEGQTEWPDLFIAIDVTPNEIRPSAQEYMRIYVMSGRSKTRGYVALNGTAWRLGERDDTKVALIDYQLLQDPADVEVIVEGIKIGLEIVENTVAFQRFGATYPAVPHPECLDHFYRSDPYWRCYIGQEVENWLHFCGTNSMGRVEDPMAVVDSKLKVIGVLGLRVMDASVMPVVPNGNTNAPIMMVAEKGADEILREHLGQRY